MPTRLRILICLSVVTVLHRGMPAQAAETPPEQIEFFERQIRPLLVTHCIECHGGRDKIKGELRLTSRQAILTGGESGPAVVPGKPDESLLLEAINYAGLKMPPDAQLDSGAIAKLKTWIELGVPWPDGAADLVAAGPSEASANYEISEAQRRHWAFQPVGRPPAPPVNDNAWPKTDIDRFILAALEQKNLTPSPAADPRTLLRRVTFDLVGLPPTPAEVAAFAADPAPDAFAKVVDRLLASPAYGERWGRYWLDVARYADNKGYIFSEDTNMHWAYTYRDYVVRAFNADLPYDRFIVEQLAADQLPLGEDRRPLTALGFITCGGIFMKNTQDIVDDRIDVVTRGLLGLTVSCARCHNHKFDPIPTADYYSLYGVLVNAVEPLIPPLFAAPPQTDEYAAFDKELRAREQALMTFVTGKYAALVAGARTRVGEYLLAAHALHGKPRTDDFMLIADGDDLNPTMIIYWQAYLERTAQKHHPVFAPWHALAALQPQEFAERARELIANMAGQTDPARPLNPLLLKALADRPPTSLAELAERYREVLVAIDQEWQTTLAQATASGTSAPTALADADREELRQVLYGVDAAPNGPFGLISLELLPDRPSQEARDKLLKPVEEWRAKGPGAPPRAMVLEDAVPLKEPYIFLRGNPNQRGRTVPRQFLQILSPADRQPFTHGAGRLDLAQAIASPTNPLTARVLVNRVWQQHFGTGLVRTPSDFGMRSQPPSHPLLLDYLAATFMQQGWSLKKLHRQIVLSAVYQQQSLDRPEIRQIDPENTLLWRANRRRLDFESMRDALLEVAGRLDKTVGGPSVANIAAADSTRRTLYGYVDRQNLPGLYRTFDFPSPDASSPARDLTTVPQQALFWMNSPLVSTIATHLLARAEIAAAAAPPIKIALLYPLLYGREATADELQIATGFLGDSPSADAWNQYAQSLLLANEFVFID